MWFREQYLLLLLAVIAAVLFFWRNALSAREEAVRVCRAACRRQGHQLLDDTVSLVRLRIARSGNGWPWLRRTYEFDFSADGHDRLTGSVTLLGARVESIHLPDGAREF